MASRCAGLTGRNLDRASWEITRAADDGETYRVSGIVSAENSPSLVEVTLRWAGDAWSPVPVVKDGVEIRKGT